MRLIPVGTRCRHSQLAATPFCKLPLLLSCKNIVSAIISRQCTPDMVECGLRKDPQLWFQDGNIVLVAQGVAFRVHRGILSRHSETFNNLFTIPPPSSPDSSEELEGLPVINVSDSAHDFKHLLHALYDGSK